MKNKKLLLCILDGFGIRNETYGNAAIKAKFIHELFNRYSNTYSQIQASEEYVGLPKGQFGNSEVGHMTIGAGRVIKQKIDIINDAVSSRSIENSDVMINIRNTSNTIHVMGIFSSGGVHGHMDHIIWAVNYLRRIDKKFWLHLFLDGRDVSYNSAIDDISKAINTCKIKPEEIATIQGRFYAMDRDNNMDRTSIAYEAITKAIGNSTNDFISAIQNSYNENIYDEQVKPIVNTLYKGSSQEDIFWMLNYRTDRIKQILSILQNNNYKIINMVNVTNKIDSNAQILFPEEPIKETLGEIISKNNLKQLRVAETEKYAHVTYFFNGGREEPFKGEDRTLIASPKTTDYSTCPEMSCKQVKNAILEAIQRDQYDIIIANFANPDMVGHTGMYDATCDAITSIDKCIEEIYNNLEDYSMIITADHGNCEQMYTEDGEIHKSHTCNPVPFVFVGDDAYDFIWRDIKTLADIATAILKYFDLQNPTTCLES